MYTNEITLTPALPSRQPLNKENMKLFLLLTIATIAIASSEVKAQIPVDEATNKFKYQVKFAIADMSQEVIYGKAKDWIVRNLKSSDNIIALDDENKATITSSGNLRLQNRAKLGCICKDALLNFKFTVKSEDGNFTIFVENFDHYYLKECFKADNQTTRTPVQSPLESIDGFNSKLTSKLYEEVDTLIKELIKQASDSIIS